MLSQHWSKTGKCGRLFGLDFAFFFYTIQISYNIGKEDLAGKS
jgi:hypothetical protein